mmetsp:Transcript_42832/g.167386  ORF Transcript_42832/g.167386 Transcript_42832/m.167386 type:complete len:178 (+) Transcript_42832:136-669(+)
MMEVEMVRNSGERWVIHNPQGKYRVISTKNLVGTLWLEILQKYDCRVEVCTDRGVLSNEEIVGAIGSKCDGVLGQLTEKWDDSLFSALKRAGVGVQTIALDCSDRFTGVLNCLGCVFLRVRFSQTSQLGMTTWTSLQQRRTVLWWEIHQAYLLKQQRKWLFHWCMQLLDVWLRLTSS